MAQDKQQQEAIAWVRKGVAALREKDIQLARRCLLTAKDLDPENADAWLYLSATTRDLERRRRILWRVLTIKPDHPQARRALAEIERLQLAQARQAGGTAAADPAVDERCPDCGAVLRWHARAKRHICIFCGFGTRGDARPAVQAERLYPENVWPDEVTVRRCLNCASISLLPDGMSFEATCPVCMHHVLERVSGAIPAPDLVVPFEIDESHAAVALEDVKLAGGWWQGVLRPRRMTRPRPLLLPVWVFSGVGHARYTTADEEANELEYEFDEILISGVRQFEPALYRTASEVPFETAEACDLAQIAGDTQVFTVLPSQTWQSVVQKAQRVIARAMHQRVQALSEQSGQPLAVQAVSSQNLVARQVLVPAWINEQRWGGRVYMGLVSGVTGDAVSGSVPGLERS